MNGETTEIHVVFVVHFFWWRNIYGVFFGVLFMLFVWIGRGFYFHELLCNRALGILMGHWFMHEEGANDIRLPHVDIYVVPGKAPCLLMELFLFSALWRLPVVCRARDPTEFDFIL